MRLTHFPISTTLGKVVIFFGFVYMAIQTALFVGSFNLFNESLRIIAATAFIIYCLVMLWRLIKLDFQKIIQPITINLPILILAIGILIFVHIRGPLSFNETIFNFDWGKYNIILYHISQNPFEPQIDFGGSYQHLAYYYAIYLPAGYIGYLLQSSLSTNTLVNVASFIFDGWLLLGQILVVMMVPFVINALFGKKKYINHFAIASLFFVLFAQMDGWEIFFRTGELFRGDLEWGPGEKFYLPLRLQSFLSSSFWVPGHFVASILGLSWLIIFQGNKKLHHVPLLLVYTYTLSSSLFAFISLQLLFCIMAYQYSWQEIIALVKAKIKDISAVILACSLILLLYALNSLFNKELASHLRLLMIIIIAGAIALWCLTIPRMRSWLQRYWLPLWALAVLSIVFYFVSADFETFGVISLPKYLVFFAKEFGHFFILIGSMHYILDRSWRWPKIIIAAFLLIVSLSVFGSQDFMFSGSIGALVLINLYLGYLFERLAQKNRLWFYLLLSLYLLSIAPSLHGLYYETFGNVPYQTNLSFDERILMNNWKNVFFDRYTSPYIKLIQL